MLKLKSVLLISLSLFIFGCGEDKSVKQEFVGIFQCQDKAKYMLCSNGDYYATVMVSNEYNKKNVYPSKSLGTWSAKGSKVLLTQSYGYHSDIHSLNFKKQGCKKISDLDFYVSANETKAPACDDERVQYLIKEEFRDYVLGDKKDADSAKLTLTNIKNEATYTEMNRDFYKCSADLEFIYHNDKITKRITYGSKLVWSTNTEMQGNITVKINR